MENHAENVHQKLKDSFLIEDNYSPSTNPF